MKTVGMVDQTIYARRVVLAPWRADAAAGGAPS